MRWTAFVVLMLVLGSVVWGAAFLNQPLMPGHVRPGEGMRRGGYQVQFVGWSDWRFGVGQMNMVFDMAYGRPCRIEPYARGIDLGPVSISH